MSGPKEPNSRDDADDAFGRRAYDHDRGERDRPPGPGYGRRDYDQPRAADARDRDDERNEDRRLSRERGEERRDPHDRADDRRDRDRRDNGHESDRHDDDRRETHGHVEQDQSGKRRDDRQRDRHGDGHDRDGKPPGKRDEKHGFRRLGIALVVIVLIAALGAGILYYRHHHRLTKERKERESQVSRGPRVFYSKVDVQPAERELTVTADVRGFSQTTVYAKVAGYVKSINVDKGDHVHDGQLIGVLESPEVDQQVAAAEADLVIKKRTFERYQKLVAKDFVSAQDFETARAQYGVSQAQLRQMRALQAYETLRAPFAGTVTARYVDPGALVPAATGSTESALPMVDIADLRRLRITVFVQQDAAPFLHAGDPVTITVDERPDLRIHAVISRFARALDTRSRMMLCEVWIDNTPNLYPGTFVHVKLRLKGQETPQVPSSALLLHDNKPAVVLIKGDKVQFVTVRPGIDDGRHVQILEGVKPGDQVALNFPAEIPDGATVQPVEQQKPQQNGEASNVDKSGPQQQATMAGATQDKDKKSSTGKGDKDKGNKDKGNKNNQDDQAGGDKASGPKSRDVGYINGGASGGKGGGDNTPQSGSKGKTAPGTGGQGGGAAAGHAGGSGSSDDKGTQPSTSTSEKAGQ